MRREAREEAAIEISDPIRICEYLVSPGGTSEICTLFGARTDSSRAGGTHGLASEHEDIHVEAMAFDRAMALLADDRLNNAKTIIGLQWLALNRPALRKRWS